MSDREEKPDLLARDSGYKVAEYFVKLKSFYRTGNGDPETLISLIKAAMGKRSQRKFADDMDVNVSSISRILGGKVTEVSDILLAKIAAYADPDSGVTLEQLMQAQGIEKVRNFSELESRFESSCRRIMADELLKKGFSVSYPQGSLDVRKAREEFDFQLITDAVGNDGRWLVEVKTLVIDKLQSGRFQSWINRAMAVYYRGEKVGRISMAVEDKLMFEQIKSRLSEFTIPDEISVLLVSVSRGAILDEYVAPLKDGRVPMFTFKKGGKER